MGTSKSPGMRIVAIFHIARHGSDKRTGGNRSAWGETLPSVSAGFLVGGECCQEFPGGVRKLAATGTSYPISGLSIFRERVCDFVEVMAFGIVAQALASLA
jgi:hypothetical protein